MKLRRNSNPYKIMKYLLLGGGVLLIASLSPVGGTKIIQSIIGGYLRKKRFEKDRFLRDLKKLQERDLLDFRELPNGEVKIILTKKGKKVILSYNIDDIKLDTTKKWDGKWRLVMFDIPHYKKKARDAFREKLRELGFYAIQKSVFITPYSCENEVDFICSVFEIRQFILILYVSHFEGDEKFRYYFKI